MTNQQVFSIVYLHLISQNSKAARDGKCYYRTPDGRKCAIGILIPDENYDQSLEGLGASQSKVLRAAGLSEDQAEFARELQRVHDLKPVARWEACLAGVAEYYALTVPSLDDLHYSII